GGRVDTRIGAPFSLQFRRAELCLTRRCQCGHPSIEPSRLLIITVGVRHLRSLPVEKPKKRFHPFRPSLGAHPLVNAECGMGKEKWRMADGRWRMADGEWRLANGRWRMADGRWQMPDGGWQMPRQKGPPTFPGCQEVGGPFPLPIVDGRLNSNCLYFSLPVAAQAFQAIDTQPGARHRRRTPTIHR